MTKKKIKNIEKVIKGNQIELKKRILIIKKQIKNWNLKDQNLINTFFNKKKMDNNIKNKNKKRKR